MPQHSSTLLSRIVCGLVGEPLAGRTGVELFLLSDRLAEPDAAAIGDVTAVHGVAGGLCTTLSLFFGLSSCCLSDPSVKLLAALASVVVTLSGTAVSGLSDGA